MRGMHGMNGNKPIFKKRADHFHCLCSEIVDGAFDWKPREWFGGMACTESPDGSENSAFTKSFKIETTCMDSLCCCLSVRLVLKLALRFKNANSHQAVLALSALEFILRQVQRNHGLTAKVQWSVCYCVWWTPKMPKALAVVHGANIASILIKNVCLCTFSSSSQRVHVHPLDNCRLIFSSIHFLHRLLCKGKFWN